jgi:hypothetical protein
MPDLGSAIWGISRVVGARTLPAAFLLLRIWCCGSNLSDVRRNRADQRRDLRGVIIKGTACAERSWRFRLDRGHSPPPSRSLLPLCVRLFRTSPKCSMHDAPATWTSFKAGYLWQCGATLDTVQHSVVSCTVHLRSTSAGSSRSSLTY